MEDYVDITMPNIQPEELRDLKPEAREVFERRLEYHNMISDLLENHMVEVTDEVKTTANAEEEDKAANAEDEDVEQQEEEKKEEKTLYDIHFVYRTVNKRLNK